MASNLHDMYQMIYSPEVIAVAGIQIESVRVCAGRDKEVRETTPCLASFADDCGRDEPVAPHSRSVERDWVQFGLDFLQSHLPFRGFARCGCQVWTCSQLGRGDR